MRGIRGILLGLHFWGSYDDPNSCFVFFGVFSSPSLLLLPQETLEREGGSSREREREQGLWADLRARVVVRGGITWLHSQ